MACQLIYLSVSLPTKGGLSHLDKIPGSALNDACSNKVVEGQETLRVLWNSLPVSPPLIRPPWLHELRNRSLPLLEVWLCFVVFSGVFCSFA